MPYAVILVVIGVALIFYGVFRAASGGGRKPQQRDSGHGVDVVYRVPSVFDRRNDKR